MAGYLEARSSPVGKGGALRARSGCAVHKAVQSRARNRNRAREAAPPQAVPHQAVRFKRGRPRALRP